MRVNAYSAEWILDKPKRAHDRNTPSKDLTCKHKIVPILSEIRGSRHRQSSTAPALNLNNSNLIFIPNLYIIVERIA